MANWYPAEDPKQPYYPRVFRVIDNAPTRLFGFGDRLVFWNKARSAALAMWKPAASFRVLKPQQGYIPGLITLDVVEVQPKMAGQADFGRLPPDSSVPAPGVAWAHISPTTFEQEFQSGYSARLKRLIAHEVGHCLGFGHGGTGLMQYTFPVGPNAEEIAALRAYWKT